MDKDLKATDQGSSVRARRLSSPESRGGRGSGDLERKVIVIEARGVQGTIIGFALAAVVVLVWLVLVAVGVVTFTLFLWGALLLLALFLAAGLVRYAVHKVFRPGER
jgi:hypothetical protein